MATDKVKILKDLKQKLKAYLADNLRDVILFGSQLFEDKNSDYDILIIVAQQADWKLERKIVEICYEIDLKYDVLTDVHVLSESELNTPRGKQPIYVNAINKGYHV